MAGQRSILIAGWGCGRGFPEGLSSRNHPTSSVGCGSWRDSRSCAHCLLQSRLARLPGQPPNRCQDCRKAGCNAGCNSDGNDSPQTRRKDSHPGQSSWIHAAGACSRCVAGTYTCIASCAQPCSPSAAHQRSIQFFALRILLRLIACTVIKTWHTRFRVTGTRGLQPGGAWARPGAAKARVPLGRRSHQGGMRRDSCCVLRRFMNL